MQTIKLIRKSGGSPEVVNTQKFYYALRHYNVVDDIIIVGDIPYQLSTITVETPGNDAPQTVIVPNTSAQAKTWFSSPQLVIPAPGVGKFVRVTDIIGKYNFGTIPYTDGFGPYLKYASDAPNNPFCAFQNSLFYQASGSRLCTGTTNITNTYVIPENQGIHLYSQISNPAGGDGNFIFLIKYLILDII